MNLSNIYRGLIIVAPYGTWIYQHKKKMIVKSKNIQSICDKTLLLIEKKTALGLIKLDFPRKINLLQFAKLRPIHMISDQDRHQWWPKYKTLYAYDIIDTNFFRKPVLINYPTGPQITVTIANIIPKKIFIGTSGYYYKSIYPLDTKDILQYYSQKLTSVELNSTFYRMPSLATIKHLTKYNLTYCIKVNRYITHTKRLHDIIDQWKIFYDLFRPLYDKIGCFLFQFSATFSYSDKILARLETLADILDSMHHYAFEFRHESWFNNDKVTALFNKANWIMVIIHITNIDNWTDNLNDGFNPKLSLYRKTSNSIYIRLHGTTNQYSGSYNNAILNRIYKFIEQKSIINAFIYFNNTENGNAFNNAITLAKKFNPINK